MTAVILPIGHYLGPHYGEPTGHEDESPQPGAHRVRIGADDFWLETVGEARAWGLAHGLGALSQEELWTRAAIVDTSLDLDGTDLSGTIDLLLSRSLLVEIDPAADQAASFARRYRLCALAVPLGRDGDTVELGLGGVPAAAVTDFGYAVWRAAQSSSNLKGIGSRLAAEFGDTDEDDLIVELIGGMHALLGVGAAYLDVVEGAKQHAGDPVD